MTQWRARHVGFIFQMYNLIPVLDRVSKCRDPLCSPKTFQIRERRQHVKLRCRWVGLAIAWGTIASTLGGPGAARAIARAIVSDPTFFTCDEPTGDLDRKAADEIMDLVGDWERVWQGPS